MSNRTIKASSLGDWLDCPRRAALTALRRLPGGRQKRMAQAVGDATHAVFGALVEDQSASAAELQLLAEREIPDGATTPVCDAATPTRASAIGQAIELGEKAARLVPARADAEVPCEVLPLPSSNPNIDELVGIQGRADAYAGGEINAVYELKVTTSDRGGFGAQVGFYSSAMDAEPVVIVANRKSREVNYFAVDRTDARLAASVARGIASQFMQHPLHVPPPNPLSIRCHTCAFHATDDCHITKTYNPNNPRG